MNKILDKMITKLFDKTLGSFFDSQDKHDDLLLEKCFTSRGFSTTIDNFRITSNENDIKSFDVNMSMEELAKFLSTDKIGKKEILDDLNEFHTSSNDIIADLFLLNLTFYHTHDEQFNKKVALSLDSYINNAVENLGIFDSPTPLKFYLDKVSDYLKNLKEDNQILFNEYEKSLSPLLGRLATNSEYEDDAWISVDENFAIESHAKFIHNVQKATSLKEVSSLVHNYLTTEDNLEAYQTACDYIKQNLDFIFTNSLDKNAQVLTKNLTEDEKEFIAYVVLALYQRELSITKDYDRYELFSQNIKLKTKVAYENIKESFVHEFKQDSRLYDDIERLLNISLRVANNLYHESTNEYIHDYDDLLEDVSSFAFTQSNQKPVAPKTKLKYVSDTLDKLIKIIYEKDKVYSKMISKLQALNVNRLTSSQDEMVVDYAEKFLPPEIFQYLSSNIDYTTTEKEFTKDLINQTIKAIISEKAQFGNFISVLKKDMVAKIAKDILTSSNKETFTEKFEKLLDENVVSENIKKTFINLIDEIYAISNEIATPILKDEEIPYSLVKPSNIKKLIVQDSSNEEQKYPNLYKIVRFSQTLEQQDALKIGVRSLTETKSAIDKTENTSTNVINKIDDIKKLLQRPIASKEEREDIKKMIRQLSYDIKKIDNLKNKTEILDELEQLPSLLNAVKFEDPKLALIRMVEKKTNDPALIKDLSSDLAQLTITTQEYLKNKYVNLLLNVMSTAEIENFKKSFDLIAIQSQNSINKRCLKNDLTLAVDELISSNNDMTPEEEYRIYQLCEKAKLLVDYAFKIKGNNDEYITKLKNTISDLFTYSSQMNEKFQNMIEEYIQDNKLSKLNLQNVNVVQNIKRELSKELNPEVVDNMICDLNKVKTEFEKNQFIEKYKDQLSPTLSNFVNKYINLLNVADFEIKDFIIDDNKDEFKFNKF